MRHIFLIILLFIVVLPANSQTGEDSVKSTVNRLFTAMKNADPDILLSCFSDSVIFQSLSTDQQGKTIVKTESVHEFASLIGKLQKNDADERISFDVVRIDANLAVVWAPYQFYYKGKFSHCGADSFQLIRVNGQWKIQYLIDTRRKDGCMP
jgi:hypothetical protein